MDIQYVDIAGCRNNTFRKCVVIIGSKASSFVHRIGSWRCKLVEDYFCRQEADRSAHPFIRIRSTVVALRFITAKLLSSGSHIFAGNFPPGYNNSCVCCPLLLFSSSTEFTVTLDQYSSSSPLSFPCQSTGFPWFSSTKVYVY